MTPKRIIILGSNGMLGQMVDQYFQKSDFEVISFNERFSDFNFKSYVDKINCIDDGIVVNCIGKIKQKTENNSELLLSNTILPLELARTLKSGHILIHPSTDCVFDGKSDKHYEILEKQSATDVYGWSKSLGETALLGRPNTLILRVSIVGPDVNSNKGLLSWFLNNSDGSIINGFTNHYWNGITTLEWCMKLHKILLDHNLLKETLKKSILQLGTGEIYTKYQMLNLFKEVFEKEFTIIPVEAEYIYRCLVPSIISGPLKSQLTELKKFLCEK